MYTRTCTTSTCRQWSIHRRRGPHTHQGPSQRQGRRRAPDALKLCAWRVSGGRSGVGTQHLTLPLVLMLGAHQPDLQEDRGCTPRSVLGTAAVYNFGTARAPCRAPLEVTSASDPFWRPCHPARTPPPQVLGKQLCKRSGDGGGRRGRCRGAWERRWVSRIRHANMERTWGLRIVGMRFGRAFYLQLLACIRKLAVV
jgi:hypothetical protein